MFKMNFLIDKYIKEEISTEERRELKRWVEESEDNLSYFRKYLIENNAYDLKEFDSELGYQRFLKRIEEKRKSKNKFVVFYKYAAMFIGLVAVGYLIRTGFSDTTNTKTTLTNISTDKLNNEKIRIKLADGSIRTFNDGDDEVLTNDKGEIVASKNEETIDFTSDIISETVELVYNEISIPKGKTFKIKLSDGTMVWLNAGSKLRFPENFASASGERVVYLDGEAFFDVTTNKNKPFIVNTNEVNIQVLGTQFNVSNYDTDNAIETTLVEGAVKVYEIDTPEHQLQLTPSYQASFNKVNSSLVKEKVDTSIYTSWMKNKLIVDGLTFSQILKKLERSHDVAFINNAKNLDHEMFKGEFRNDQNIETILKTISLSTPFIYEINQNTITISK
ncbi:FecR family protein [Aquimarina sediminis]|uniref:FecR family protein n=1 Tax=Aquimarina sediminis TaxID=2070536 RepID=UPI000CA02796|nr:FecR family protein [Aquimarina sediminis]